MKDTINTLLANGLKGQAFADTLAAIIDQNEFVTNDDRLGCVLYAWTWESHANPGTADWTVEGNRVTIDGATYLVVSDIDAHDVCMSAILDSLSTYDADFIGDATGISTSIIHGIIYTKHPETMLNAALEAIVRGTCGLETFRNLCIDATGMGRLLATDDEEIIFRGWHIYRVN